MNTILYFEVSTFHLVVAFLIGLGTSLGAALYPAIKFSRYSPLEAMRR